MKTTALIFTIALLAGCSSPSGDANAPAPAAHPETPASANASPSPSTESMPIMGTETAAITASASGTVEAVDTAAKTITIAHGPVDALKWPAMTMTFQAPDVDLAAIKKGDHVAFEFTSSGMNGTITKIVRQP